ncbi:anoctamin-5-like [Choristoneura fumiferana]|uniref:anoctamin-5-like n=1 Tax=Choristoneura fumiferana TaxID=7141 RepID=UPI003D1558B6
MERRNKKRTPYIDDSICHQLKVIDYGTYGKDNANSTSEPIEEKGDIKEESTSLHKLHYYDQRFNLKGTQYRYADDVLKAVPNPLFNRPIATKNDEFRDGRRRIDLVLAQQEDGRKDLDEIRTRFLHNILRTGLDLEIVRGTMRIHKNLLFIKIHAPDTVLDEFNHLLCTKKYFKSEHVRFVKPDQTIIGKALPFTRVKHEREMITLARKEYKEKLYLSNSERSLIVYKILLQLPFGDQANHFGLNRLLDKKVFLDAYALHDGEYFAMRNEDRMYGSAITNARQMLFYTWVGKNNAFKVHPLNLIREYFGEKVGMYFAFYEFYNHALLIAAVSGLIVFISAYFNTTDKVFERDVCANANNTYICPRCNSFDACPFIKLTNFCYLAKLHRVLDNPYTVFYAIFLTMWAAAFYVLWKRKQSYWVWLWEINTDRTKDAFRTNYSRSYLSKPLSTRTGLDISYAVGFTRYIRLIVISIICISAIAGLVALLIPMFMYKRYVDRTLLARKTIPLPWVEIALVVIFAVQVVFVVQIFGEFMLRQTLNFLTKLENHRTYESYFRSYSLKLFVVSFMLTFPLMFYYAWVKGAAYYLPFRVFNIKQRHEWSSYRGYFSFTHCAPFTCLDEVFTVLAATLLIRYIALPLLTYFKEFIFNTRTDFNQGKKITTKVPCWEREFRLDTMTEEKMARKYNSLVLQFALVSLVGAVFPLAPLFAFFANVINIRYEARMFLLCHRRPLLLETAGIGVWKHIIKVLALLSVPANALTLARTTKMISRQLYTMRTGSMRGFLFYVLEYMQVQAYEDYYLSPEIGTAVKQYRKNHFVPQLCYFPGLFGEPFTGDIFPIYFPRRNFTFNAEHFWFRAGTHVEFSVFSILIIFCTSMIFYAISSYNEKLKSIINVETKMENDFLEISEKYN